MQQIDFHKFKIRNPNYRADFEELCYHLVCRKFDVSEGIRSDFNETGLETKPFYHGKRWHGFQAKFFDGQIDGSQIMQSVEKAIARFEKSLNVIHIYLNRAIGTQAKYANQIEALARKHKMSIEWIVPSNFTALLAKPSNLDLAQFYFGHGDEFGFIKSCCDPEMSTLLQSSVYLPLPLKGVSIPQNMLKEILLGPGKTALILGYPGSGKTALVHRLLLELGGLDEKSASEQKKTIQKRKALPMLVNLKGCTQDSIENIIRNRKKDYKVQGSALGFIYLFDGLDELSTEKADIVLSHLALIAKSDQAHKIIISCRSGNPNRYTFKTYFPVGREYEISSLGKEYIDQYFKAKGNKEKLAKLKELETQNAEFLGEIKDVFLITLLWETATKLSLNSSFIDLFQHKLNLLLEDPRFKKNIEELNLLDEKRSAVISLNQNISYEFQKRFQHRFTRQDIQQLIMNSFPRISYRDANAIFNYLSSHFFTPRGNEPRSGGSYIYQHRRYQEFFLAQKLKTEYENNRRIIRDSVLSNLEFLESIFFRYLRQEYERDNNLPKLIELNLMEVYLGRHSGYGAEEHYYSNASNFIPSLALQDNDVFERLLDDDNLRIREKIVADPSTIVHFWKGEKKEFAQGLLAELFIRIEGARKQQRAGNAELMDQLDTLIWDQLESWLFIKLAIKGESAKDLLANNVRVMYQQVPEKREFSYEESGREKLLNAYFKVCLDCCASQLVELIKQLEKFETLALLSVLSDIAYLKYFFGNTSLQEMARQFLAEYSQGINEENAFLLFYKKLLNIELTEDEKTFAKNLRSRSHQQRVVDWRFEKTHLKHALASYSLGESAFPFIKLDSDVNLPNYYNELIVFSAVFGNLVDVIRGKITISQSARGYLEYLNTHEKVQGLYLKHDMTLLWSRMFAESGEPLDVLRNIKTLLLREGTDILSFVFLRALRTHSAKLFRGLSNEHDLDAMCQRIEKWDDDFLSFVESCFDLAIAFSVLNGEKATVLIAKGINEGILRHGWRKDVIVSYFLVEALDILWRNNWLPTKQLAKYAEDLFQLTLRVSDITDGKGTWQGPYNVLEVVANYDVLLAEKLMEKLYDARGYYNTSNSARTTILLAKVRQGLPLDEVESEMKKYRRGVYYDSKPDADIYEQRFLVYLAITKNDLYSPQEKKQAFLKAHGQVQAMIADGVDYYLRDSKFRKDKEYFEVLCAQYETACNVHDEDDMKETVETTSRSVEQSFIVRLERASKKSTLLRLFRELGEYKNGIVLKKKESWDLLLLKTYEACAGIGPLIEFLKINSYPHTDFFTSNSKYLHFAVGAALRDPDTKDEMLKYLYSNTGYQGFLNVMRAYEVNGDQRMCQSLFKEYFSFCEFLVN
jgi:hypothetical protein